jgi:glycosyltransferase involved in cell wall biosynthesis
LVDSLEPGGVQKAAVQEALYLKSNGVPTDMIVIKRNRYNAYGEEIQRISPIFLSDHSRGLRYAPHLPMFHYFSGFHLFSAVFPRQLMDSDYDLVVSHGSTTTLTAYSLSKRKGTPYFAFIWDPMIYIMEKVYGQTAVRPIAMALNPLVSQVENIILRNASVILTCSRVHSALLKERYGIGSEVIYPGTGIAHTGSNPLGDKIVAFTRWELAKNPNLLLRILEEVPDAILLMAGQWRSNQERAIFIQEVQRRGLTKRVEMQGYYDDNQIQGICAQARVWVHPNFEAFGMGGLEAASYGCPIVIPKGSGVTELFTEGEHGFFPPAKEHKEWVVDIRGLLTNQNRARQMGQAAQKVAQKYTWEYHSERLRSTIRTFLDRTDLHRPLKDGSEPD